MSPKSEVVRLQRRFFHALKAEILETTGPLPPSLQAYSRRYRKQFSDFQQIHSLVFLQKHIEQAEIVFFGDYHSFREAQRMNLQLLKKAAKTKRIVLCTEIVCTPDQSVLDQYMNGVLSEKAFLQAIRYNETFGFDWSNYRPIFEFARREKMPVIGIDKGRGNPSLLQRDRWAAKIIAEKTAHFPSHLLWVMIGELHIAEQHLPALVKKLLPQPKRSLIIFQNNENLFWKAAPLSLKGYVQAVQINNNAFCVLHSPPWAQLHSYINWLEKSEEESTISLHDQAALLLQFLADFLKLPRRNLFDFCIYSRHDDSFLEVLKSERSLYSFYLHRVKERQDFILTDHRVLYLGTVRMNHLAEITGRFLHSLSSGYRENLGTTSQDFFKRICHFAAGFLSSKIVNHYRIAPELTTSNGRKLISVTSLKEQLRNGIKKNDFEFDLRSGFCISRYLGSLTGAGIYRQIINDEWSITQLREFFSNSFEDPPAAEEFYFRFDPFAKAAKIPA